MNSSTSTTGTLLPTRRAVIDLQRCCSLTGAGHVLDHRVTQYHHISARVATVQSQSTRDAEEKPDNMPTSH